MNSPALFWSDGAGSVAAEEPEVPGWKWPGLALPALPRLEMQLSSEEYFMLLKTRVRNLFWELKPEKCN